MDTFGKCWKRHYILFSASVDMHKNKTCHEIRVFHFHQVKEFDRMLLVFYDNYKMVHVYMYIICIANMTTTIICSQSKQFLSVKF